MHFVPPRYFLDGFCRLEVPQANLGLEICRKSTPCRHLVLLRYPEEYALEPCPIFWDQLKQCSLVFIGRHPRSPQKKPSNMVLDSFFVVANRREEAADW